LGRQTEGVVANRICATRGIVPRSWQTQRVEGEIGIEDAEVVAAERVRIIWRVVLGAEWIGPELNAGRVSGGEAMGQRCGEAANTLRVVARIREVAVDGDIDTRDGTFSAENTVSSSGARHGILCNHGRYISK